LRRTSKRKQAAEGSATTTSEAAVKAEGLRMAELNGGLQTLGKFYLDTQQQRIASQLRMQRLERAELVRRGVATERVIPEEERKPGGPKTELVIKEEDKPKVEGILKELRETRIYKILEGHVAEQKKEEKNLLGQAEDLFDDTALWRFCLGVRGLGPVAAMTFFTVINPAHIIDPRNGVGTAGKVWSYLGLRPGQQLRSGQKSNYNTQMKGRVWVISNNVILASDQYYAKGIFRIQKHYYERRPDILAQKDARKGWKKWVNAMAVRWMRKLLIAHAAEIIIVANGGRFTKHTNYIPPKPELPEEQAEVLARFEKEREEQLQRFTLAYQQSGEIEGTRQNLNTWWEQSHQHYAVPAKVADWVADDEEDDEDI
jgi:hypothetical protein